MEGRIGDLPHALAGDPEAAGLTAFADYALRTFGEVERFLDALAR